MKQKAESQLITLEAPRVVDGKSKKERRNRLLWASKWDKNFTVKPSKNNEALHTSFKEFFDRPIKYDKMGSYSTNKYNPMDVYHMNSPIRSLKPTSDFFVRRSKKWNNDDKRIHPKDFRELSGQQSAQTQNQIPFLRQSNLFYRSQKSVNHSKKNKNVKSKRNSQLYSQIQKRIWDNQTIGMPISAYNERVHPSFRIDFNDIST